MNEKLFPSKNLTGESAVARGGQQSSARIGLASKNGATMAADTRIPNLTNRFMKLTPVCNQPRREIIQAFILNEVRKQCKTERPLIGELVRQEENSGGLQVPDNGVTECSRHGSVQDAMIEG